MTYATPALAPGTRVRARKHHDLIGTIEGIEYCNPGCVAGIPYRIRWDDSSRAAEVRGWLFVYGSDGDLEPLPTWAEHQLRRVAYRQRRIGAQRIVPPRPRAEYIADVLQGRTW